MARKKIKYEMWFRFEGTRLRYIKDLEPHIQKTNGMPVRHALFACDCGGWIRSSLSRVKNGSAKSCGCMMVETHAKMNKTKHPLYVTWAGMLDRCNNENNSAYKNYGGRGISVCSRWSEKGSGFYNFLNDMGDKPDDTSLDRVDVDGNYSPENCIWSYRSDQNYRTRKKANNTSGRTGVYINFYNSRGNPVYEAYIGVNGDRVSLGFTEDFSIACSWRKEAEVKYYGYSKEDFG